MADRLIITLAQLNQQVGDLAANSASVRRVRAQARDSDLIVFPEMHLVGYPPEDLIQKPALIARAAQELEKLAAETADGGPALLVGSVLVRDGALHNGVALLEGGRIAAVRFKYELPNYGTFDEKRYFLPGPLPEPVLFKGAMLGLPICEDIWHPDVCRHLAQLGAEIFICVNGSPYEIDKDVLRIDGVAKRRAIDTGIPLVYLNRVGGQDEVVFDGASFVVGPEGAVWIQAPDWEKAIIRTEWNRVPVGNGHRWRCSPGEVHELAEHPEDIYCAMVLALRGGRSHRTDRTSRRHLLRDGAGPARLCEQEPLSRRRARPVGRNRFGDHRRDRGRCPGRRPGVVRDVAQPLYQPGEPG